MTTNDHVLGHRQRIKEKFLKNPECQLADYELLELLLTIAIPRKDVKPLAKELISKFGSFLGVINASVEDLTNIKGVGEGVATTIKIVMAATNCCSWQKLSDNKKNVVTNLYDLIDYCIKTTAFSNIESFKIVYLNSKGAVIGQEVLQTGTTDAVYLYPREVVNKVIKSKAKSVVLIHNHPSGDPSPSKPDIEITKQIIIALKAIDVMVFDHVIVCNDCYYSFQEQGLMAQISTTSNL